VVKGPVFDPLNWSELGDVEVIQENAPYTWGEFLDFGMGGNADPFTGRGWASASANGRWSDGKGAHLKFQVDTPGEDVEFLFAMRPFLVPGKLDRQRVRIMVNDRELKILDLTDQQANRYMLTIPAEFVQTNEIRITFQVPDAAVPEDLGVGGDKRMLGISVMTVCLYPQSMTPEILDKLTGPPPGDS
jgi:hypothetical protein